MDEGVALLRSQAQAIGLAVAESNDVGSLAETFAQIVTALADKMETGGIIDPSPLTAAGMDDVFTARVLRATFFECIERFHQVMDDGAYNEAVLALRSCIHKAIPRPDVSTEDREFYRRQILHDYQGLDPDYCRLLGLFEDLALTVRDIVYIHDLNGMILYLNQPGLELTRFTVDDVFDGLSVYDFVVPEFLDFVEARLESPRAVSRVPCTSEICTKDGERIPIEVTTQCIIRNQEITGIVGFAKDLRLARRLENEIRRSSAFVDAIVANAPMGILVTDCECAIMDANPAAVSLFGASGAHGLIGSHVYALCQEGGTVLRDMLCKALAQDQTCRVRMNEETTFGAALNVDVTVVPLRHESEQPDRLLILMIDASNQAALQKTLLQSEKLSALGEIVAGVAHEMNNPLTGILGYAQLLLNSKLEGPVLARINSIVSEAERCRRIVQNLLTFSRQQNSQKSVQDVNEILSDTMSLREYQLHVDGIDVVMNLSPEVRPVVADPYDLRRVFLNIVSNAQQALATVSRPQKQLVVDTRMQDDSVHIRFADNGPGIPQTLHSKIFQPFFTTRAVGDGTGLGLSVSYGVVQNHGGHILLESKEGEGAAFTIVLPAAPRTEQPIRE